MAYWGSKGGWCLWGRGLGWGWGSERQQRSWQESHTESVICTNLCYQTQTILSQMYTLGQYTSHRAMVNSGGQHTSHVDPRRGGGARGHPRIKRWGWKARFHLLDFYSMLLIVYTDFGRMLQIVSTDLHRMQQNSLLIFKIVFIELCKLIVYTDFYSM